MALLSCSLLIFLFAFDFPVRLSFSLSRAVNLTLSQADTEQLSHGNRCALHKLILITRRCRVS